MSDHRNVLQTLALKGYCLWVGAGLGKLVSYGAIGVPSWEELAMHLEEAAGIRHASGDLPTRLQACFDTLGRDECLRELRLAVVHPTANALLTHAEALSNRKEKQPPIPDYVSQLGALGTHATLIVNFNIEHFTSVLLAGLAPYRIMRWVGSSDAPPGAGLRPLRPYEATKCIFHPHGILDSAGLCILTKNDYELLQASLAYSLAAHLALDQTLVIVGMSLNDQHLRDQLQANREEIRQIHWFAPPAEAESSENLSLCRRARITAHTVTDWQEFWQAVASTCPRRPVAYVNSWMGLLGEVARTLDAHSEWIRDLFSERSDPEHEMFIRQQIAQRVDRGLPGTPPALDLPTLINEQRLTRIYDASGGSYVLWGQTPGDKAIDEFTKVVKRYGATDESVRHGARLILRAIENHQTTHLKLGPYGSMKKALEESEP